MFLIKADLPLIRFHVLKGDQEMQKLALIPCYIGFTTFQQSWEIHLRVLSVPTVSASFPDGWTDSDVTGPLWNIG